MLGMVDCELKLEEITFLGLHSGSAERLTSSVSLGPVSGGRWWTYYDVCMVMDAALLQLCVYKHVDTE